MSNSRFGIPTSPANKLLVSFLLSAIYFIQLPESFRQVHPVGHLLACCMHHEIWEDPEYSALHSRGAFGVR
jgi:hypothetical protein